MIRIIRIVFPRYPSRGTSLPKETLKAVATYELLKNILGYSHIENDIGKGKEKCLRKIDEKYQHIGKVLPYYTNLDTEPEMYLDDRNDGGFVFHYGTTMNYLQVKGVPLVLSKNTTFHFSMITRSLLLAPD